MAGRRRVGVWLLRALAVLIIGGLAGYLYVVGLDKADKLASALSLVVAVIVLVGPLFRRRRVGSVEQTSVGGGEPESKAQAESGSVGSDPVAGEVSARALPRARRAAYLEDVRQLAPRALLDREPELAELATFCVEDEPTYWRWVADAWSGKSALLAWFVLHPPENVDVVSFFITSRFNPHNHRDAFIEAVTEQLDALIGVPSSYAGSVPVRARDLLARLADAADRSRRSGRRLVLVVDGLDEDRGVSIDSETYTIAAMLPANPVPGLKVIVAGRPNPPLPPEIGADHPVRDPANIHVLRASAYAKEKQTAASLELRRLLGHEAGRGVLSLLTAAGGGLTTADLAGQLGRTRHEIALLMESSLGRTFISRPGRWRSDHEFNTYELAHEDLRAETLRRVDRPELTAHQESLIRWAEAAAAAGWPAETPEYLLFGYRGLLSGIGDPARAVALVIDQDRQDRLRSITGGDHAALVELAGVTSDLSARPELDLGQLARLALHRGYLEERNAKLPTDLPSVWAALGEVDKAEALARGIRPAYSHSFAIEQVMHVLAERGDVRWLERFVRTSDDPDHLLWAMAALIDAAGRSGDNAQIAALTAQALTVLPGATEILGPMILVKALARIGDDWAEQVQREIEDPYCGAMTLVTRTWVAGECGDLQLAAQLARRAESLASQLDGTRRRIALGELADSPTVAADQEYRDALLRLNEPTADEHATPADLVTELIEVAGHDQRAGRLSSVSRLVDRAVVVLRTLSHSPDEYLVAATEICEMLGQVGDTPRALALIDDFRDLFDVEPTDRRVVKLLEGLAHGLTRSGHHEAADDVLGRLGDRIGLNFLLSRLATMAAESGDVARARVLLDRLASAPDRLKSLPSLARAFVKAGDDESARAVIEEGFVIASSVDDAQMDDFSAPEFNVLDAVSSLAELAIEAGRADRAEVLAGWVETRAASRVRYPADNQLTALARALIDAGDVARAEQVIGMIDPTLQAVCLEELVDAIVGHGDHDLAEAVSRRIESPPTRITCLTKVVRARSIAGRGGLELATDLSRPLATEGSELLPYFERLGRSEAIVAVAAGGDYAAAARLADGILNPDEREWTIVQLCLAAAEARLDATAEELSRQVERPYRQVLVLAARIRNLTPASEPDLAAALITQAVLTADRTRAQADAYTEIADAAIAADERRRAMELLHRARTTALTADDSDERDRVLKRVVELYAALRAFDDARLAAVDIEDSYAQVRALQPLVNQVAATGDPARIEMAIRTITAQPGRTQARTAAVLACAAAGNYRCAGVVAEPLGDDTYGLGSSVLPAIVKSAAQAGDFAFAESAVNRIGAKAGKAAVVEAWCELAGAAGDSRADRALGWIVRAETVMNELEDQQDRGTACLRIAAVAPPGRSERLVAQAFADGPWHLPLAEMAHRDPTGLASLADSVANLHRRRGSAENG